MYGFGVHAFGCEIRVAAGCVETYSVLERYVFPSFERLAGVSGRPDVQVRLDRVGDRFQLTVDDRVVASAGEAASLVPELIRVLDEAVITNLSANLTRLRAVHAGAVVWGGRALLLPGITHAGKSSLVAELIRRGATYFSDEYALIDADGLVHPYPRPLLVRNGGPEQSPILAGEYGARTGDRPAPVGWILSLEYVPECTWSVGPISQSEGVLTLLRNTPHVLAESPEIVEIFERAVSEASCYVGRRNEAAESVGQIVRLMESVA